MVCYWPTSLNWQGLIFQRVNLNVYSSTQISEMPTPPLFNRDAPYFVNIFFSFWHPNMATSLFLASFVPLKLHVILSTSLIFVWILPIFVMLMLVSSEIYTVWGWCIVRHVIFYVTLVSLFLLSYSWHQDCWCSMHWWANAEKSTRRQRETRRPLAHLQSWRRKQNPRVTQQCGKRTRWRHPSRPWSNSWPELVFGQGVIG